MDATPEVFEKCGHSKDDLNSEVVVDARRNSTWITCKTCRRAYERARAAAKRRGAGAQLQSVAPINEDGSKPCSKCHTLKAPDEFAVNWRARDGRTTVCKPCHTRGVLAARAVKKLGPLLGPTWRDSPQFAYLDDHETPVHQLAAWLRTEYVENGKSLRCLAREARTTTESVMAQLKRHEIHTRARPTAEQIAERAGQQHYNWQGKMVCPTCGDLKKTSAEQCKKCHYASSGGENARTWAGSSVGYAGLHMRLRKERGAAAIYKCGHCGRGAEEWAYDHQDPDERYDDKVGHYSPYSLKFDHYQPLCRPCHRDFDREQIRQMIREGGSDVVASAEPPEEVTFSFHWLAQTARNNQALWIGIDGCLTIRDKATYRVVGISPDFKGLMCRRIDVRRLRAV